MNVLLSVLLLVSAWPHGDPLADLRLRESLVCDPACVGATSAYVENLGPDDATHVVVTFTIPDGAVLESLDVDAACRVTSPGTGGAGAVVIEVDTLEAGRSFTIGVSCGLPTEEGWTRPVVYTATAAETDPTPEDAVHESGLRVPFRPRVDAIRELTSPYRLELTGANMQLRPFGKVSIGSCDEVYPDYEDTPDGTRLVLLGGRNLRRLFPRGKPVVIQMLNLDGGYAATVFSRP